MNPDFSIIIPTYNRASLIQRAINSVLNQTYQNFELIIVDDCSVDDTKPVVDTYNDFRIKYVTHERRLGASAARNTGIRHSTGYLISFLDSDDEYLPTFLEETKCYLYDTTEEYGFSWSGTIKIKEILSGELSKTLITKTIWQPNHKDQNDAYTHCLEWDPVWGTGHGFTAKSFVFSKIGLFDENLKAREDMDFLIRLMKEYKYKVIPKYLINIYLHNHDVRVDSDNFNKANAYIHIMSKHKNSIKNNQKSYMFFHTYIAQLYRDSGLYGKSIFYLMKIIRKYPYEYRTMSKIMKLLFFILFGRITKIISSPLYRSVSRDLRNIVLL